GRALEHEHAFDQRGAFRRAQHRRDEVAAFGDDLRARHRVVAGAAHGLDVLAELRAVGEHDLDNRLPARRAGLELRVAHDPPVAPSRSSAASRMRATSCAASNETVRSISITATMCWRQMSGMSRLFTTDALRVPSRTTTLRTSPGANGRRCNKSSNA